MAELSGQSPKDNEVVAPHETEFTARAEIDGAMREVRLIEGGKLESVFAELAKGNQIYIVTNAHPAVKRQERPQGRWWQSGRRIYTTVAYERVPIFTAALGIYGERILRDKSLGKVGDTYYSDGMRDYVLGEDTIETGRRMPLHTIGEVNLTRSTKIRAILIVGAELREESELPLIEAGTISLVNLRPQESVFSLVQAATIQQMRDDTPQW